MRVVDLLKAWMLKLAGLPTCEEVTEFAYGYLEGELDSRLVKQFERHLRACGNCSRFVDSYREVARPERLLGAVPLDPDFERRVAQFLRENR